MNILEQKIKDYPNAKLSVSPIPIYKLEMLSSTLNHSIFIMREDMTGFNIGGNKVRKLDYLIGDALRKNADTLITTAASSFSRNAAAAGKKYGLDVHVVIQGKEEEQNPAGKELFELHDTKLYFTDNSDETYSKILNKLQAEGKTVYELHPGGSDEIGSLGYVNAFNEIVNYSAKTNVHFNRIILPTGSTATQVGIILGNVMCSYGSEITGIAVSQKTEIQIERVTKLLKSTSKILEVKCNKNDVIVDDSYIGPGYSIPSKEGISATKLFANTEGILLDQVYSAKAAAALIDYAQKNRFKPGDNVLFIHTGGNSGLYY